MTQFPMTLGLITPILGVMNQDGIESSLSPLGESKQRESYDSSRTVSTDSLEQNSTACSLGLGLVSTQTTKHYASYLTNELFARVRSSHTDVQISPSNRRNDILILHVEGRYYLHRHIRTPRIMGSTYRIAKSIYNKRRRKSRYKDSDFHPQMAPIFDINHHVKARSDHQKTNYYQCLDDSSGVVWKSPTKLDEEVIVGSYWTFENDQWHNYTQTWALVEVNGRQHSSLIIRDSSGAIMHCQYLDRNNVSCSSIPEEPGMWVCPDMQQDVARVFEAVMNGEDLQSATQATGDVNLLTPILATLGNLFSGKLTSEDAATQLEINRTVKQLEGEGYTIIEGFRWCVEHWKTISESPIFGHVTTLLSIAIMTGFAPEKWSEVHVNSIKVFKITNLKHYDNVSSILDGFIRALNYFVESVYASWETGNLMPFLYERTLSKDLDNRYDYIRETIPSVRAGEFQRDGGDWGLFLKKVADAISMYRTAVAVSMPLSHEHRIYSDRMNNLITWHMWVLMSRRVGEVCKQPFGFVFYGSPGCGKSGLTNNSLKLLSAIKGFKYEPQHMANITPDDAFDSQVTNQTRFVVMNDVANRPLKFDKSIAIAKALAICDNIPYIATKAEVDLKGSVIPDLIACFCSTNNEGMFMNQISVNADSLRRRLRRADVKVKEKYRNDMGGIDLHLFSLDPEYRMVGQNQMSAAITITINCATTGGYAPEKIVDPRTRKRVSLSDLEIDEFYYFLELLFRNHDREQDEHVTNINAVEFSPCTSCARIMCACTKVGATPFVPLESDATMILLDQLLTEDTFMQPDDAVLFEDEVYESAEQQQGYFPDDAQLCALPVITDEMEEPQSVLTIFSSKVFEAGVWAIITRRFSWLYNDALDERRDAILMSFFESFDGADWTQWWYWIPNDWWDSEWIQRIAPIFGDAELERKLRWNTAFGWFFAVAGFTQALRWILTDNCNFGLLLFCVIAWVYFNYRRTLLGESVYRSLSERRNLLSDIAQKRRADYSPWVKNLVAGIAAFGTGIVIWQTLALIYPSIKVTMSNTSAELHKPKESLEVIPEETSVSSDTSVASMPSEIAFGKSVKQGFLGLSDESLAEKEDKINMWHERVVDKVVKYRNPTQTPAQFLKKVKSNMSMIECYDAKEKKWVFKSNLFWFNTNICILPAHLIPAAETKWRISDNESPTSAKIISVSPCDFARYPGADMALGYLTFRSKKNLFQYVNSTPASLRCKFLCKDVNKAYLEYDALGRMDTNDAKEKVITYKYLEGATFRGACGGVYVTLDANPSIIGIHYAGILESPDIGRSFLPSVEVIKRFMMDMSKRHTVVISATETDSLHRQVGPHLFEETTSPGELDQQVIEKWKEEALEDCVEELQGAQFLGNKCQQGFYKSNVIPTIIADEVYKICPDLEFGPPRFGRQMYPNSAMHSFRGSSGMPTQNLEWASQDYLSAFNDIPEYLLRDLKPLSREQVVNGIDGKRFIDSLNFSTSMGLRYAGPKKQWVSEIFDTSGKVTREFADEVWRDVDLALLDFANGVQTGWIFNAVPKDEPTPVTKEKVRLFMVCEVCCVLITRQYFTPICRVLQMMTGISECAVGINPLSKDWEAVTTKLEKFSNVFDGDYSKYDTKMPANVSAAAYKVMLYIAAKGHYTVDDLFIMQMMLHDIIFPRVNFRGEVYRLDGSTVSGIPVTVVINSIANSLINRCGFFHVYPASAVGDFRRYVAHINYGDDFINGVSFWRTGFNFLSFQSFLADHGFKLTPGLKEAIGKKFVAKPSDLVFLQRQSGYIETIPYRFGKLHEASIWKSLLSVIKSKSITQEEAAVTNVDGALTEWFYHGASHYEMRRLQMHAILEKQGLLHLSSNVGKSFAEMHDILIKPKQEKIE